MKLLFQSPIVKGKYDKLIQILLFNIYMNL